MELRIPQGDKDAFHRDYEQWCRHESATNVLVSSSSVEPIMHNPNVTTNTSNPIKASRTMLHYSDLGDHVARFVKAYPKWAQYKF